MKRIGFAFTLTLLLALLSSCKNGINEKESLAPGEIDKWNDPNYEIIGIGAYNYTDYDIYDVFIMPPDKSDIRYAASGSGGRAAPQRADKWSLAGAAGANLAWDYKWITPRKFKVWWFRIVDMQEYSASGNKYDKYTTKETAPGGAWCEGELEVANPPIKGMGGDLVIHYYPEGHIEGDVIQIDGDASKVDIKERKNLPSLKDRACLKEVSNPYFGKKKPIEMH